MIDCAHMVLIGRLVEDPVLSDSGSVIRCNFKVASNRRVPGAQKEKTAFVPVTVFGRDAETCGEYLTQGREVYVTGNFETESYTDSKGIRRTGFGLVADRVVFGSGGQRSDSEDKGQDQQTPAENKYERPETKYERSETNDKKSKYKDYTRGRRR